MSLRSIFNRTVRYFSKRRQFFPKWRAYFSVLLRGMMIDGSNILYRNVFIKELNAEVKVTTEEVFEAHIEEGSPDDDKFYCYVPAEEFFKLSDLDFEKYVNKNF